MRFSVYYTTEIVYCVTIEAESEDEAHRVWSDPAYWDGEPQVVSEDMSDTSPDRIEEIE